MLTITTPTGHIGNALCNVLMNKGEEITIIARNPEKVSDLEKRGAKIIAGSHDDPDVMIEATKGANALFFLTPPKFSTEDVRAHTRTFGKAAAQAITANNIQHVVHLSSVGGEKEDKTGPIMGLNENEIILGEVATNLINLRPAFFMENTLMQMPTITKNGKLFSTFTGDFKMNMICTADIALRASELLSDLSWNGNQVVELHGNSKMSYNEVAQVYSKLLNKELAHITITDEQAKEALLGMGASGYVADLFIEMNNSLMNGHIAFKEEPNEVNSTPTNFQTFAEAAIKSMG